MIHFVLVILLEILGAAIATNDQTYTTRSVRKRFAEFVTPCRTPNGDDGHCVEVQSCSVFMEALASGKNDSFDFIRNSRCGPLNENPKRPKVCCGKYAYYRGAALKPRKNPLPNFCGNETLLAPTRITGGTEANLGEFPWMARLKHRRSDGRTKYGCSGFLISNRFILTAAHCIVTKDAFMHEVVLGEHDTRVDPDCDTSQGIAWCAESVQMLKTADPIVHPGYTNDLQRYNDIAVIPLEKPVEFTDYVYPICLPKKSSEPTEMWLSGWGSSDSSAISPIKLKVSVPKVDRKYCADKYITHQVEILEMQFCAGGVRGRDACQGDSGGPIMVQRRTGSWFAEGIVSFGVGCGLKGWPGVYTDIPTYLPWIKRVARRYLKENEDSSSER